MNKNFTKFCKDTRTRLLKAKNIAIFTHVSPDLDGLCSMFSFSEILKMLGKKHSIFVESELSLEQKSMIDQSKITSEICNFDEFDLCIAVDTSTVARLGIYGKGFCAHHNTIKIDHHMNGDRYGIIEWVDSNSSSCCELMLEIYKKCKFKINTPCADFLYAGLSSDTHSFINQNTNINSFAHALELLKLGANLRKINEIEYRNNPINSIPLRKIFLEKTKIIDNKIAVCLITTDDLKATNSIKADCSSFSSELASYAGIKMSCNIVQKDENHFDCSFRSNNGYDCNIVASIFGGGGHIGASGCLIEAKDGISVINMIVQEMQTYFEKRVKDEK